MAPVPPPAPAAAADKSPTEEEAAAAEAAAASREETQRFAAYLDTVAPPQDMARSAAARAESNWAAHVEGYVDELTRRADLEALLRAPGVLDEHGEPQGPLGIDVYMELEQWREERAEEVEQAEAAKAKAKAKAGPGPGPGGAEAEAEALAEEEEAAAERAQRRGVLQMHNKAVFDRVNESLLSLKPFHGHPPPPPWYSQPAKRSAFGAFGQQRVPRRAEIVRAVKADLSRWERSTGAAGGGGGGAGGGGTQEQEQDSGGGGVGDGADGGAGEGGQHPAAPTSWAEHADLSRLKREAEDATTKQQLAAAQQEGSEEAEWRRYEADMVGVKADVADDILRELIDDTVHEVGRVMERRRQNAANAGN